MKRDADTLVAVVDDERNVLDSVADLLASAGFRTVTFQSAAQLLDWEDLDSVECLVSDIRMPDMDGWQLVARLGIRSRRVPIVLMTAHDLVGPAADKQLAETTEVEVLRKPFDSELLLDAIRRALRQAR